MKIIRIQNLALYCFFFLVNFQELKVFNYDAFSLPKFSALIYLITILPHLRKFLSIRKIKISILTLWVFFGLLTIVSLFNITNWSRAYFDLPLFQFIFLFLVVINHGRMRPNVLEKAMLSLAFGSIILVFLYNLGVGIEYDEGRVIVFGDNPNIIGLRMCIAIVILCITVVQNKLGLGKIRYLLMIPIPVMFQLLAETGSRIALVSFLLCFVAGVMLYKTKRFWVKIIVLTSGVIVLLIILQTITQYDIMMLRIYQTYENRDLSGRLEIYNSILPVIQQYPIFGIGTTGYVFLFGNRSPHNVFLEILCYTGIIGMILYSVFLFGIIKQAYRSIKLTDYLLPALLFIPIFGLMASGQILHQKLGWTVFAYIIISSLETEGKQYL